MADEESPAFRSGFVALLGRPNAGKSTLLNRVLGEKIAITSNRPQTTRNRILGIRNLPGGQIVFLDTPGVHRPRTRLDRAMVNTALSSLKDVDVACFLVEADHPDNDENDFILRSLKEANKPAVLAINKIDRVPKADLLPVMDRYSRLHAFLEIVPVSALLGDGVDSLVSELLKLLPEGPAIFPEDMITDLPERFLAAEFIREKVFQLT
ncbi:MAG TPA: GTPase Era, partial [Thermodesulfobacteriota bacterium]|nr:GTPase Era [Thermodesulfobacteriota bacterium]